MFSGTAFLNNIYNSASCSQVAECVVMLVEFIGICKGNVSCSIDWDKKIRAVPRAKPVQSLSQSSWGGTVGVNDVWLEISGLSQ